MGTNLQGYHLLWPDLPTFSQLQFTAPFTNRISSKGAWKLTLLFEFEKGLEPEFSPQPLLGGR